MRATSEIRTAAFAAVAVVSLGYASGASAAILDLGNTSPLSISGINGFTTLTFSPSPDTDSKEANDVTTSDFKNLFLPQDPTNVGNGVKTLFGLSTAPTFIPNTVNNPTAGTYTPSSPFTFAAIHQGQGEIVLEFAEAQTSLTIGGFSDRLSNINFYSTSTSAIPEPGTWTMMLAGFAALGFIGYRARRATTSIA